MTGNWFSNNKGWYGKDKFTHNQKKQNNTKIDGVNRCLVTEEPEQPDKTVSHFYLGKSLVQFVVEPKEVGRAADPVTHDARNLVSPQRDHRRLISFALICQTLETLHTHTDEMLYRDVQP